MDLTGRNLERFKQKLTRHGVIALGIVGRDAAFVGPEKMDVPKKAAGDVAGLADDFLEEGARDAAAGEGDVVLAAGRVGFAKGQLLEPLGGDGFGQHSVVWEGDELVGHSALIVGRSMGLGRAEKSVK